MYDCCPFYPLKHTSPGKISFQTIVATMPIQLKSRKSFLVFTR
jgi:hypothetical protein